MTKTILKRKTVQFNTVQTKFFYKHESIREWRDAEKSSMTRTDGIPKKSILKYKKKEPVS